MTPNIGAIATVLNMIGSIKHQCQVYIECKKNTGLTNNTMEDQVTFLKQLEKKLEELKK